MRVSTFQKQIEDIYLVKDSKRGVSGTFVWFVEEVGELARAIKGNDQENLSEEFADVLAWLSTLASLTGIDLAQAASKYAQGCPKCHGTPCTCCEENRLTREQDESPPSP